MQSEMELSGDYSLLVNVYVWKKDLYVKAGNIFEKNLVSLHVMDFTFLLFLLLNWIPVVGMLKTVKYSDARLEHLKARLISKHLVASRKSFFSVFYCTNINGYNTINLSWLVCLS